MPPKRVPVESLDFHTEEVWTWSEVDQNKSGKYLEEIPSHWPDGISVNHGRWSHWLPDGWGQGFKKQPNGNQTVFISPDGRVFWRKADVEKHLGTVFEKYGAVPDWPDFLPRDWALSYKMQNATRKLIYINPEGNVYFWNRQSMNSYIANEGKDGIGQSIRLRDETLRKLQEASSRVNDKDSGQAINTNVNPSNSESTTKATAHAGNDSKVSNVDGYYLEMSDDRMAWIIFPDDVESIALDVFTKHFQAAGWQVESTTPEHHTFTRPGHVSLVLHSLEGKLLVQSEDKVVARDIAERYLDWICNE